MTRAAGTSRALAAVWLGLAACEATTPAPAPRAARDAPSARPAVAPGPAAAREGTIDAQLVADVLRANVGAIRACYERGLAIDPTLRGRIEVRFTIDERGACVNITARGLASVPTVATCMETVFATLRFPPPEGGTVEFSFPFNFMMPDS